MKKTMISLLMFFSVFTVSSASPFDIITNNYYPDFTISSITQNTSTKEIYVKVCNIGGDMGGNGTMTVGVKLASNNKLVQNVVQNVNLTANSCGNYKVANVNDFGIVIGGNYSLTAGVLANSPRTEMKKTNNSFSTSIYLYPTTSGITNVTTQFPVNTGTYPSIYHGPDNSINNQVNNNFHYDRNNRSKPDFVVKQIWQESRSQKIYVKICNVGVSMKNKEDLKTDIYANGVSLTKTISIKLLKDSCTDSLIYFTPNEFGATSRDSYYDMRFKANSDFRINEYDKDNNYFDVNFFVMTKRPDLTVDSVGQDGTVNMYVNVCNIGASMNFASWNTVVYSNGYTAVRTANIGLGSGNCTKLIFSRNELGISRSGYADIKIDVDPEGNIPESNRNNNSSVKSLYLKY